MEIRNAFWNLGHAKKLLCTYAPLPQTKFPIISEFDLKCYPFVGNVSWGELQKMLPTPPSPWPQTKFPILFWIGLRAQKSRVISAYRPLDIGRFGGASFSCLFDFLLSTIERLHLGIVFGSVFQALQLFIHCFYISHRGKNSIWIIAIIINLGQLFPFA